MSESSATKYMSESSGTNTCLKVLLQNTCLKVLLQTHVWKFYYEIHVWKFCFKHMSESSVTKYMFVGGSAAINFTWAKHDSGYHSICGKKNRFGVGYLLYTKHDRGYHYIYKKNRVFVICCEESPTEHQRNMVCINGLEMSVCQLSTAVYICSYTAPLHWLAGAFSISPHESCFIYFWTTTGWMDYLSGTALSNLIQ